MLAVAIGSGVGCERGRSREYEPPMLLMESEPRSVASTWLVVSSL